MLFAKKPPLIVTVGTAILLVVGGTIGYWVLRWQAARERDLPIGTRAVPQAAIAAVTLSTDPLQWQQLRQFGTATTQSAFDEKLAEWRERWLAEYDISFSQDIQSWVGPEITLAWIPEPQIDSDEPSAVDLLSRQRRILLLPIEDPEAAALSADSLPLDTEAADPFEYRGVTLQSVLPTSGDETSALLVGVLGTQLVLVAEDQVVAQQAIDAYKGGSNLADVAGYRRSFEHIGTTQAFGKLYLDIPAATQLLAQTSQPALPPALLESFQENRGLAATVEIASQGLQIQSTSWLGPGSDFTYADTNVPAQLPQYLPRDTLVMASGGNFQQFWQDLNDRRNWGALTALNPDNLELALQGSTGLTLADDLLPWMNGEFALALVPPQGSQADTEETSLPDPGWITIVQVSDRPLAEQAFATLDEVVENRYRFTISDEPEGDIELVKWTSPFESVALSRGWLDSSVAFLTVGLGTEEAIVPKPRRSLAKAPMFQLTTGDAPYPNNGYFFINFEALDQVDNNLFLPNVPIENQGILRAIQALGVTATVLDDQRLRYDIFLALERGNRPGPLPSPPSTEESAEPDEPEAEATEEAPPENDTAEPTSENDDVPSEESPEG